MRRRTLSLALVAVLSATGCGQRGAMPPAAPAPPAGAPDAAPSMGKAAAKILAIEDARKFEARPQDPSTPSMQNAADLDNKDRVAHTVGRQRSIYGGAGPNIFLPAGETVAGIVRATLEKALREKGYRIIEEGSPDYAGAATLSIEITQFWTWQTPRMLGKSAEFRTAVVVTGDALSEPSTRLEGYASDDSVGTNANHWRQIIQAGVDDLGKKIAMEIKPPPANQPASP